jgi:hypothetical protein
MSLLLALVGEEPPAVTPVGRRFKHYAKGYLKRGNEVLVFSSQQEAEDFEAAEIAAKEAISRAQKKKVRAAKPKPIETVNLERVERQVSAWQMPYDIPGIADAFDFDRIMRIQLRIAELQDEEDIELLLTL